MILEIPRTPVDTLLTPDLELSSALLREKVLSARNCQQQRFKST